MPEQPFLREFAGIGLSIDCELTDVMYRLVELRDLGGRKRVTILLGMDPGVVEDLVPRKS